MSDQPAALRLAEHLERFRSFPDDIKAAAELRRLHGEVEALRVERDAAVDRANKAIVFATNCAYDEEQPEPFRAVALQWLETNTEVNAAIDVARGKP